MAPIFGINFFSVFTVLTFEKKEKGDLVSVDGDRCSQRTGCCCCCCVYQKKKPFSHLLRLLGSPLNLDFFFCAASFSLTVCVCTCSCRGGLVEGMLLKSIEKPKNKFRFPPFSSSSKAIKVVYHVYHPATRKYPHPSTTTRL